MADLRWTVPSREDDTDWLGLLAAMEAVDVRGETYTAEDLEDEWASVWSHPATDAVFLRDEGTGALVAFGWLKAMPGERDVNKVACWGGVHPARRGQGIGRQLLTWQVDRGRAVAAGFDDDLGTRLEVEALATQPDLLRLAADLGFERARGFLEVARPVGPLPVVAAPEGIELVPWTEELDERVRLAHTEAFAEHWGVEPRTSDVWRQWYTGHRHFRTDLSLIAVEGDDVAGFVLCAAYPADWDHTPREAWIQSFGTRPAWRGRALGRWLLTEVPVVAVDLPGRGRCPTPMTEMTIATCVDAIVDQLAEVGGDEVVLVGHSMAGLAVPAAAIRLGPGRVRRLVYVTCNVPPDGGSTLDSLAGPLRPLAVLGTTFLPYGRGGMPWPLARLAFCNGMTPEQRRVVRDQLGPESPAMVRERVDRSGLDPSITATWVLTQRDRALSPKQQRRSIERLGGAVDRVVELDACHDVMVSHPQELAEILLTEARR